MKKEQLTVFIICIIALINEACNDINEYSVSPNHLLTFSCDTLTFDTVFTSIGSVTGYFMIYNKNDEALMIDRIVLASGGDSGFRINVDGRKGNSFENIPIWKKDSLYVAVEVTVDPNNNQSPFVIYDSVVFITNGMKQYVTLETYGQNAHIFRGGTAIVGDTTLQSDLPYLIFDDIYILEGVTLTVDKGVAFYMHKNAQWIIQGTLKTFGTQEEPVVFRGDRLYNFSSTISYDNISAQWNGLFFTGESFNNELNYTIIRNGIYGLNFDSSSPDIKKIDIRNSQITNMDGNVLWAENCYIEASNTEFSNATYYLAMLAGGKHRFAHCTFANYMPTAMMSNVASRSIQSLILTDNLLYVYEDGTEESNYYPLYQAYFDNCIIDGNLAIDDPESGKGGELYFVVSDASKADGNETFNYCFNHCLIKTKTIESMRFINNIFEESPTYIKSSPQNENKKSDFIYDFRLKSGSVCIGKADRSISEIFPTDRYGINRLTSEYGPSIGAYEYDNRVEDEK